MLNLFSSSQGVTDYVECHSNSSVKETLLSSGFNVLIRKETTFENGSSYLRFSLLDSSKTFVEGSELRTLVDQLLATGNLSRALVSHTVKVTHPAFPAVEGDYAIGIILMLLAPVAVLGVLSYLRRRGLLLHKLRPTIDLIVLAIGMFVVQGLVSMGVPSTASCIVSRMLGNVAISSILG
jgi:hypothetical protein